jgi:hypothetical protein
MLYLVGTALIASKLKRCTGLNMEGTMETIVKEGIYISESSSISMSSRGSLARKSPTGLTQGFGPPINLILVFIFLRITLLTYPSYNKY